MFFFKFEKNTTFWVHFHQYFHLQRRIFHLSYKFVAHSLQLQEKYGNLFLKSYKKTSACFLFFQGDKLATGSRVALKRAALLSGTPNVRSAEGVPLISK